MSNIVFVRHAQASFFSKDYDKLSEHGKHQARQLGDFWNTQNKQIKEVYVGPCLRHRQTAEIALAAAGLAGTGIIELSEFDEHQVDQLVIQHQQDLAQEFPELVDLVGALKSATERHDQARSFQRLFEAVCELWITGKAARAEVETWLEFQERVNRGITKILAGGETMPRSGRQIAVFSSVGPLTVAFQRATECSDGVAISTGWRLRNCSLTQAAFSADRFTLDSFNTLSHLPDQSDWTYR